MTGSIYAEMIRYEEVGGDLVQRLSGMNAHHIFKPVIEHFATDHSLRNKAIFYILHTYSLGSKYHVLGQDWLEIKEGIADKTGIEHGSDLYNQVVLLESREVINTIQSYIDHQGNRTFKHLIMLKELYEQMYSSSLDAIKKAGGTEIDYDQKNKNKDYATKILDEINTWEQRVADSIKDLKEGIKEIQKKGTNKQNSIRLEDNLNPA